MFHTLSCSSASFAACIQFHTYKGQFPIWTLGWVFARHKKGMTSGVEHTFCPTLGLSGLKPVPVITTCSISEHVAQQLNPLSFSLVLLYTGDTLALSINNLDSLVQMPLGCGEQNIIHFAPSIYVLQYLDKSSQDDQEIRSRALHYMTEGMKPLRDSLASLYYSKCTGKVVSSAI